MENVSLIFQWLGGIAGFIIPVISGLYFIPHSPIRRLVETWIERRVSHRFNEELETYRHKLELEADQVRTEHQRLLHNAVLIVEKMHEISRELFRLIHIANGHIASLYGLAALPTFEDYSLDDLKKYMDNLHVPGKTAESIHSAWDLNRPWALKELKSVARRFQISKAQEAYNEAWNFYILNSLYLNDQISAIVNQIFLALRQITIYEEMGAVDPDFKFTTFIKEADKQIDELRKALRAELQISNSSILQNTKKVELPAA